MVCTSLPKNLDLFFWLNITKLINHTDWDILTVVECDWVWLVPAHVDVPYIKVYVLFAFYLTLIMYELELYSFSVLGGRRGVGLRNMIMCEVEV